MPEAAMPTRENKLVLLTVDAPDCATEIQIINPNFQLCGAGLGKLELNLAPGVYKVRFKTGDELKEQHVALWPTDIKRSVSAKKLLFSTPVPLEDTRNVHEYFRFPAEQLSQKCNHSIGNGSQLFLFIRDDSLGIDSNPNTGLSLRDGSGKLMFDFAELDGTSANFNSNVEKCWGATIQLDPGYYILRLTTDKFGVFEQTVFTCAHWQTQIFLQRRSHQMGEKSYWPDLADRAILMADISPNANDKPFNSSSNALRLTEIARAGLADQRRVLDPTTILASSSPRADEREFALPPNMDDSLNEMFEGKFKNPMLGIYGCHLLLLDPKPDMDLFGIVLANLTRLIGPDHPDLVALRLWKDPQAALSSALVPPMLQSSWNIFLNASRMRSEIIPAHSSCAKIASNTWSGGASLTWRLENQTTESSPRTVTESLRALAPLIAENLHFATDFLADSIFISSHHASLDKFIAGLSNKYPLSSWINLIADWLKLSALQHNVLLTFCSHFNSGLIRSATLGSIYATLQENLLSNRFSIDAAGPSLYDSPIMKYFGEIATFLRLPPATVAEAAARIAVIIGRAAGSLDAETIEPEPEFASLFDGSVESFFNWRYTGPGCFVYRNSAIRPQHTGDCLLYYPKQFRNFVLRLQFRATSPDDAFRVLFRLQNPEIASWSDNQQKGSFVDVDVLPPFFPIARDRWLELEIRSRGRDISVRTSIPPGTIARFEQLAAIELPASGVIAICPLSTNIEFRNFRIQEL